jgi:hypothetical protein
LPILNLFFFFFLLLLGFRIADCSLGRTREGVGLILKVVKVSKEEGFGLGVTVAEGGEEVFWTKKLNFLSLQTGSHLSTISLSGCNLSSINGFA